ncbi:hypothetical protein [Actinomadura rugatobispora]|uniref:Sel1 repeat family protein n=1 Tax=Actinomadura rugatobispora TaxID=1994 RepID=A0ABW1ABZ8_9ACTN|nr:hypothetical protein GCM10010200_079140 [Actinomadura rugatobispora]
MSDERPWSPEALQEFIRILEDFRRACGRPSLRKMERLSEQVAETQRRAGRDLPSLSLATLSNVLNGRRSGPPDWRWVATFVLTCQRYAVKAGLIPADPGESTLPQWNAMLQEVYLSPPDGDTGNGRARVEGRHTRPFPGLPAPGDPPDAGGPSLPLAAPVHVPDPDQPSVRNGAPPARPVPVALDGRALQAMSEELMQDYVGDPEGTPTLTEQRMLTLFGRHGVRLVRAAESGDPESCFELGVLLCLEERPQESLAWLMQAESRGHGAATALIESLVPATAATEHAYLLGRRALADGDLQAAQVYLERAARRRHVRAAFELGAALPHDRDQAVYWFSRAADLGHDLARWWAGTLAGRDPSGPRARLATD